MRRLIAALALVLTSHLSAGTTTVEACSCISNGPACQAYWKTDAVFDGTVVSIKRVPETETVGDRVIDVSRNLVTLRVSEAWKGASVGAVDVTTNIEEAACGFEFKPGARYLVFAHSGIGGLQVSLCSLTQAFEGASEAIRFLRALATAPAGGRIFGRITTVQRELAGQSPFLDIPTEAVVKLSGPGGDRHTRSTAGRYEFGGLGAGRYTVEVEPLPGLTLGGSVRTAEIADVRGCAEESYVFAPDTAIRGTLVRPGGQPLPRVPVEVTSAEVQFDATAYIETVIRYTDEHGAFTLEQLSPGRYILGVNLRGVPQTFVPYGRLLYPGGGQEPQVLTVTPGRSLDVGVWQLPPPLERVRLTGVVTGSDGKPASSANVRAFEPAAAPRARIAAASRTDAQGRFTLELWRGRTYELIAESRDGSMVTNDRRRLEVTGDRMEPVTLVLAATPRR